MLRASALIDQAVHSAIGFALTLTIARQYEVPAFAAYGTAVSVALVAQSFQRTGLNIPNALLDPQSLNQKPGPHLGQYLLFTAISLAALMACFAVALLIHNSPAMQLLALSSLVLAVHYFGLEAERVLLFKSGRPIVCAAVSLAQGVLIAAALLGVWIAGPPLETMLGALIAISLARTVAVLLIMGRPQFRAGAALVGDSLRRDLSFSSFGTLATLAIGHGPVFVLGLVSFPAAVAAFVAMRAVFQPLQLVVRGLDSSSKILGATGQDELAVRAAMGRELTLNLAVSAAYAALVLPMAHWIEQLLFAGKFADHIVTLYLWAAVMAAMNAALAVETAVFRLKRVRQYMTCQIAGGAAAFAAAWPLCSYFADQGAAIASILGWMVMAMLGWRLTRAGQAS
ncbi:MAG: hypothetical protein ACKVP5_20295 [Aestuariivirga sp.]